MKITEEMVKAAMEARPTMSEDDVRAVLAAAIAGHIVFSVNEGKTVVAGKTKYPSSATILVQDPLKALEIGRQLIAGASDALRRNESSCDIQLYLGGTATIEFDN